MDLPRVGGGTVNPSAFAGHVLVVLFCPASAPKGAEDFADPGCALSAYDGWLLRIRMPAGVTEQRSPCAGAEAVDADGTAWAAFRGIAPAGLELDPSKGATFLFARGGSLERVWPGVGRADEVIQELARPCFRVEGSRPVGA
jgi:hypothetical protein